MRRMLLVMSVAALMVAMIVATAMPAFAQGRSATAPNCEKGNDTAFFSPGEENRSNQADSSLDKNQFGTDNLGNDKNPNAAFCSQE